MLLIDEFPQVPAVRRYRDRPWRYTMCFPPPGALTTSFLDIYHDAACGGQKEDHHCMALTGPGSDSGNYSLWKVAVGTGDLQDLDAQAATAYRKCNRFDKVRYPGFLSHVMLICGSELFQPVTPTGPWCSGGRLEVCCTYSCQDHSRYLHCHTPSRSRNDLGTIKFVGPGRGRFWAVPILTEAVSEEQSRVER